MKPESYIAYVRISSDKQSDGASLSEQKRVIAEFARSRDLEIGEWIEEIYSAAKPGRPQFGSLLRRLRRTKTRGVIIHKIDRNARNMKDWGDFCALLDAGLEAYAAADNLDLRTREGRLFADLLAALACDYSRNLSNEVRKGALGRLHNGIWPYSAPLGYLDQGPGGKLKKPDPERAVLVRQLFEDAATGRFSIAQLHDRCTQAGLTTRPGRRITPTNLNLILRNPFYAGLLRDPREGTLYAGKHEALIDQACFDRVQQVLDGKIRPRDTKHDYALRQLIYCKHCEYVLTGERQKGRVYYRCHTRGCPTRSIREDRALAQIESRFAKIKPHPAWKAEVLPEATRLVASQSAKQAAVKRGHDLKLRQLKRKREALLDAYLDKVVDEDAYKERSSRITQDIRATENALEAAADARLDPRTVTDHFELFESLGLLYEKAGPRKRREIVETWTSNRWLVGDKLVLEPLPQLLALSRAPDCTKCGEYRYGLRTEAELLLLLLHELAEKGQFSSTSRVDSPADKN